jgi:hypothetical protein
VAWTRLSWTQAEMGSAGLGIGARLQDIIECEELVCIDSNAVDIESGTNMQCRIDAFTRQASPKARL